MARFVSLCTTLPCPSAAEQLNWSADRFTECCEAAQPDAQPKNQTRI